MLQSTVSLLFAPRAKLKPLAEFLRRMAISLEAGIDIRKVLASEARRSPPALARRVEAIQIAVERGSSLADAMNATGDYFPDLARELVGVGEHTGHLTEVLKQLSAHYEEQLALRRAFLSGIAWPMAQLGLALGVVGLLILVMGWLPTNGGQRIDILGFGLIGSSGLLIYCTILALVGAGAYMIYRAIASGRLWVAPIQRFATRIPKIGAALRSLAVARFAWTLHLALDAALDLKTSLSLALDNTHNFEFIGHREQVLNTIQRNREIHEALAQTRVFPIEFIHAVQVGEESGRLVETLALVSRQYREEAGRALALLTRIAAYAVWFLVAGFIIMLIFRIFGFYLAQLPR